jgi:anaerobic selenocysteine-containing dehydrogenase
VTGAWLHEGGGAFHNNGAIYHWNKEMIEANALRDPAVRELDQSRIGAILTGDDEALLGGPPVAAMLIQNTNPVSVAPDQSKVKRGFARDDLFVCVHEQFLTETARMADIVLPATMFTEHDDLYQAGGSQYILLGPKLSTGHCRIQDGATSPGWRPRSGLIASRISTVRIISTASNGRTGNSASSRTGAMCPSSRRRPSGR